MGGGGGGGHGHGHSGLYYGRLFRFLSSILNIHGLYQETPHVNDEVLDLSNTVESAGRK